MSPSKHRIVELRDGRKLAYVEYGAPDGPAIVYCHGVPSSRVEGDLILDGEKASALGLRIVVPDRPGLGHSQPQPSRRIVDWPNDVLDLAGALGLERFAVLGSSGGSPYALACGALAPERAHVVGVLGGVAPADAPGVLAAMSGPLRLMFRLARFAPALLRGMFRLNLRAMQRSGPKSSERVLAWAPAPDRAWLERAEIRDGFMACFVEACRQGTAGAVLDLALIARPWGFDLASVGVPTLLWHGELDRNVPVAAGRYLAAKLLRCTASFYPDEAHLSLPLGHQEEILGGLRAALANG